MRFYSSAALVLGVLLVGCEVVVGHQNHGNGGKQIPFHEREYIQDPVEELERKWSFEVSFVFSNALCGLFDRNVFGRDCLFPSVFPLLTVVLFSPYYVLTWIKFAIKIFSIVYH
jgi:hypothetical protein